jgi:hypothetical protein
MVGAHRLAYGAIDKRFDPHAIEGRLGPRRADPKDHRKGNA